jgi:hypothetical protein
MDSGEDREPDPESLDRVRRALAELGSDEPSAPEVPAEVTERIGASLRRPRSHAVRPGIRGMRVAGLIGGLGATVLALVVGVTMLVRAPAPALPTGPTAKYLTVPRPPQRTIPLTDPQLVELLSQRPQYGPLADPARRASCLMGLGYATGVPVLGALPIDIQGRPGVLMLLPGDTPGAVTALAVEPNCNSAHTGLLADTVVARP